MNNLKLKTVKKDDLKFNSNENYSSRYHILFLRLSVIVIVTMIHKGGTYTHTILRINNMYR